MGIFNWLVAGGLTGWAASVYMGTTHQQALTFNIVVAVLGAAVGTWVLGPTFGLAEGFSAFAVIVGAVCGAVLLVVVHVVQRSING